MPSPVFLWEGAYGGAEPLPYAPMMGFRRAACPHAAAKGGQGRSPLRKYWNARRAGQSPAPTEELQEVRYGEVSLFL